mmetsp:Transcript_10184/g.25621  ORF Transcript_10184/g.25621 Transcript_10184/m.25621 type:complete len:231 (-) Transcript_10184:788-1480(-)
MSAKRASSHALGGVVGLGVEILELLDGVRVRLPHSPSRCLEQPAQHVLKSLRVALSQLVRHGRVECVTLGRAVEHELVHVCSGGPPHHRRHALRHLVGPARALRDHGLRPLRVEQLGAVLQPQRGLELTRPDLRAKRLHDGDSHFAVGTQVALLCGFLHRPRICEVLCDVGESVLHRVHLLHHSVRGRQQGLQHLRPRHPLRLVCPRTAVRERVARHPRVAQFVTLLPLA